MNIKTAWLNGLRKRMVFTVWLGMRCIRLQAQQSFVRSRSKNGTGIWKLELIEKNNPDWNDLYDELVNASGFPFARE